MNFKTTLLLVLVLVVVGVAYYATQKPEGQATKVDKGQQDKLVQITDADVQKLSITPAGGKTVTLEKSGAEWSITAPVKAKAEKWSVDDLVRAVMGITSRGTVDLQDKAATGLDAPTKVEIVGKDGKTTTLAIGSRSAVGDTAYAQLGDGKIAVISADVLDKLEDPLKKYRDQKLLTLNSSDVKQVVITRPEGELRLEKSGSDWRMTRPETMPVDGAVMTDLLASLTGLRASEFVAEDLANAPKYGLAQPRYTAWLTATAPATQPPTSQPAPVPAPVPTGVTVKVGTYDDIRKQNVYVAADNGPVAKTGTLFVKDLQKKAYEFRDRKVLDVDAAQVSRLSIVTDSPATTQPTTRPTSTTTMVVVRNEVPAAPAGPPVPASMPATTQAASQPTTQEIPPKWVLADGGKGVDEGKVGDLLRAFAPLRASRYLEKLPEMKAATTYTVGLTAIAPGGAKKEYALKVFDRGENDLPVGQFNGLTFELERDVLPKLSLK